MPEKDFPYLLGAWEPYAPPGALEEPASPGLFRDVLNLIVRYGTLQRRPSVVASALSAQPDPTIWTSGLAILHGELPVYIWTGVTTSPAVTVDGSSALVVVTSKQAYASIDAGNTWTNIVPTYSTGTVTATNGSTTVTGAGGTLWQTRGISANQFILIDGAWYRIASVTNDTTLVLASNFTGATAGGKAYTIRRVWGGGSTLNVYSQIFCRIFNGNLYLGGTFLGDASGSPAPAVIKVADVLTGSPVSSYLTGSKAYTAGLDFISGLTSINGIDVLQIGSVVFVGDENVFYYSSNLSDAVWTTSPGGFEPVYMKPGAINAMGRFSNNLTLHFEDGIVLAVPVAQAEPPVAFQVTDAQVGCYASRTLKNCFGAERFIASDGRYYTFDGARTARAGDPISRQFADLSRKALRYKLHAAIDSSNEEYWLFWGSGQATFGFTHQIATNRWWKHQYAFPIGAVSDRDDAASLQTTSQALVGVGNYDGQAAATRASMLFGWIDGGGTGKVSDAVAAFSGLDAGGHYFQTEDLDFGLPYHYKSIQRIIFFFQGTVFNTETLEVSLSKDDGASWYATKSKAVTHVTSGFVIVQYSFDEKSVPAVRVRLRTTDLNELDSKWLRFLIVWEQGAEVAQVEF